MRPKILVSLISIFLVFISTTLNAHDYYLGQLTIDHPYIEKPMPGMDSASGYLVLKNKGNKSDFLVSIETLFSKTIELHKMSMVNDVMKMTKIYGGLEIPPGEEIILKPGGYHIMFKKINKDLTVGEKLKAILKFKNTGKIIVNFEVEEHKHSHTN